MKILSVSTAAISLVLLALFSSSWAAWSVPASNACCARGGCNCISNAEDYGYYETTWRQWPGRQRPNQTFPQSIGREEIPTPKGYEQVPLPEASAVPPPEPGYPDDDVGLPPGGVDFGPGLPGAPAQPQIPGFDQILPRVPEEMRQPPTSDEGEPAILPNIPPAPPSPESVPALVPPPLNSQPKLEEIPKPEQEEKPEPNPKEPPPPLTTPDDKKASKSTLKIRYGEPRGPTSVPRRSAETPRLSMRQPEQHAVEGPALSAQREQKDDKEPDLWRIFPKKVAQESPSVRPSEKPPVKSPAAKPRPRQTGRELPSPAMSREPRVAEVLRQKSGADTTSDRPARTKAPAAQSKTDPTDAHWLTSSHPNFRGDLAPGSTRRPKAVSSESPRESSADRRASQEQASRRPLAQPVSHSEDRSGYGKPPVAVDGWCPIDLIENKRWTRGRQQLSATYKGRVYLFSGPQQRAKFLAAPDRYAPAYGGLDPVLLKNARRRVPGMTKYCATQGGRLYMFAGPATLEQFRKRPQPYTVSAR